MKAIYPEQLPELVETSKGTYIEYQNNNSDIVLRCTPNMVKKTITVIRSFELFWDDITGEWEKRKIDNSIGIRDFGHDTVISPIDGKLWNLEIR